ncbi:response regulator [Myceligenerans pegani]|uniref:Response regulator transcription factor n=1 Tax=Myceligenerans pegani TaxID=2776917 RepID=A0ABR9MS48_9MICO|nr:response regulator transcription factor [Myceligenerans sp. TRM 65318]MBE1874201.1 response regulator transcription factor [Myceligenerans sp. TRM 65318]MBE3016473.1 response regulator transcription factor [Myceligenerans sp. TRM 65318]
MSVPETRVVVVDDQRDVRSSFRMFIDSQPDMRVVGEAADGPSALHTVRHLIPDVVLMDIRMPELDGLEATRLLMKDPRTSHCRIIVVTTFDLDEYVSSALALGASGFLLKRSGPTLLTEAIRAAANGDMLVSPQITVRLLRHGRGRLGWVSRPGSSRLSARETEVARLVAQGRTNADIAEELTVSAGTVKTHVANIAAKLQVHNRVGIAAWAWEHGIAEPTDYT